MRPGRDRGAPRGRGSEANGGDRLPRVVIFEAAGSTHVEVLELPPSVAPGGCFDHCGTTWQVTGTRTRQRVFIVRPASA